MWKKEHKTFDRCPGCGGRGIAAKAQQEMIERGLAKASFHFFVTAWEGRPINNSIQAKMPIGSHAPNVWVGVDVCSDCGLIFAREIDCGEVVLTEQKPPPRLYTPN